METQANTTELNDLPPDHQLRNTPLIEIGAFYLCNNAKVWREVFPAFGIAKCTYNQLGEVWTRWDRWKATKCITDK
jgi:hypothetical protein